MQSVLGPESGVTSSLIINLQFGDPPGEVSPDFPGETFRVLKEGEERDFGFPTSASFHQKLVWRMEHSA
jgi:hypothetical protein